VVCVALYRYYPAKTCEPLNNLSFIISSMRKTTTVEEAETGGYQCGICGKEFDSEEELEKHIRRIGIVE
jgi:hypothetical protein